VNLSTSNPDVLSIAQDSWGRWQKLFPAEPLSVSVAVGDGVFEDGKKMHFSAVGGKIHFRYGISSHAVFSRQARKASMRVSTSLLEQRAWFQHHFLDTVVLTALDSFFFTPLHAACIVKNGKGVLLCGDSGAGKSTLAYACARNAWTLLSDDAVHAAPGPGTRVVGISQRVHLRRPAQALFPELLSKVAIIAPNGKEAIEIPPAERRFDTTQVADVSHAVFLSRRPGPARVSPFPLDAAVAYFLKYLLHQDRDWHEARLRELLPRRTFLLEFAQLRDAEAALAELAETEP
jgi:hypothetical protein